MLVVQACLTLQLRELCPAGSSGHGILQGRMLEGAAMPLSRGPFLSRGRSHASGLADGLFTIWATWEPSKGLKTP